MIHPTLVFALDFTLSYILQYTVFKRRKVPSIPDNYNLHQFVHWGGNQQGLHEKQWPDVENFWTWNWEFGKKNYVKKNSERRYQLQKPGRTASLSFITVKLPKTAQRHRVWWERVRWPKKNNCSSEINEFQTSLGRWQGTTSEASNDAIPRINRVKPRNAVRWWL